MESGYLYIKNDVFPTLLAISASEQAKGLMHEPFPPPIMSFIYSYAGINNFWMKDTPSPLDIVFCHKGRINQICHGIPFSTEIISGNCPSNLIVEFPAGTVKQCGIKIGDDIGLIKPTELELKTIIAKKYY